MGRIFFGLSAVFFFLAAVAANLLPNPTAWGLFFLALGSLTSGWVPWRKGPA